MGELGALFNPGMRHELEERQAKAARREEEGNAKDGDLRIDLESGIAVISAPGGQQGADAQQAERSAAAGVGSAHAASDSAAPAPTEAGSGPAIAPARYGADPVRPAVDSTETAPVVAGSGPERRRAAAVPTVPAAGPRPRGKRGLSASTR